MIILNVTYNLLEGQRDAYIEAIKENKFEECSLKEEGCLQYSFFVPLNEEDKNTLVLLEKYVDEEAFEFHKQQPHFAKIQEIKALYVESTDIKIFNE